MHVEKNLNPKDRLDDGSIGLSCWQFARSLTEQMRLPLLFNAAVALS